MAKKIKKPKGEQGPIALSSEKVEWQKLSLPEYKEELEEFIANAFVRAANSDVKKHDILTEPKRNKENDFDFDVQTTDGPKYLELMEFAPLEKSKGGFESASGAYRVGDQVDWLIKNIIRKSEHYRSANQQSIYLLIYITHWAFLWSETTVNVLRVRLVRMRHNFERIFLFAAIDEYSGHVELAYPSPPSCLRYWDTSKFEKNTGQNLDPGKWKFAKGNN
ncbi:MAG: hypothetical protein IIC56_09630 [Proteobacteria bacterium]|nr:hypothetical protein [Pseudomonadota bacterium]